MNKHTPGPWEAHKGGGRCCRLITVHGNGKPICNVRNQYTHTLGSTVQHDDDTKHANAALIAAAPDLLEVLEGALVEDLRPYVVMLMLRQCSSGMAACWGNGDVPPQLG